MKWAGAFSAAAAFAALAICRMGDGRMPQLANGGDALSVAFADAKAAISAAMMHKADSYFHGGVDIECGEGRGHGHDDSHGHDNCRAHDGGHGQECAHCHAAVGGFRWINVHVRAPERHIHLDGERAVELLPWFWAAVRADPHNVDAWTTAAYAADRMMKNGALARRVIGEARLSNPDSLELALAEARMAYDGGKGDVAAAEKLLEGARALGKRLCGGRLSALSPHDAEMYCNILDYLSKICQTRGDRAAVRRLLAEARETGAETPAVKAIESRE